MIDAVCGVLTGAALERVGPTGAVISMFVRHKAGSEAVAYYNLGDDVGNR